MIIKYRMFIKCGFFSQFCLDFSTKTSRIFFFLCQFYQFSPFGHRNLKNTLFDYFWICRQKLHRTFISSCMLIKILVFFHPVCLFSTVRLLKLEGSSTLYVYSIPYYYSILQSTRLFNNHGYSRLESIRSMRIAYTIKGYLISYLIPFGNRPNIQFTTGESLLL